jgi:hypothetical protein
MLSFHRTFNNLAFGLIASLCFAGCGAEVAGAAATTAKLEAESAARAKAQSEQLQRELDAALKAREAAISAAER